MAKKKKNQSEVKGPIDSYIIESNVNGPVSFKITFRNKVDRDYFWAMIQSGRVGMEIRSVCDGH